MAKKPETEETQETAKKTKPTKTAPKETLEAKASAKPKGPKKDPASPPFKRNPLIQRTYFAKPGQVKSEWRLVDASGQTLGRLSSQIATLLMGKNKPSYTRSVDTGDFVIVINAKDVVLTGKKWTDKVYQYHTNYPGGLKTATAKEIREKHPDRLIRMAVYRMLPKYKGHMVRHWYKKLKVYEGAEHPHTAQQPQPVKLAY
jgi:large subunit ribosomal protein L13